MLETVRSVGTELVSELCFPDGVEFVSELWDSTAVFGNKLKAFIKFARK